MTLQLNQPVHIAGIGASGSHIAMHIAKKGREFAPEMHFYDGDIVEAGNTRSQTYSSEHIGLRKVDALARQVKSWGDIDAVSHPHYIDEAVPFSGFVFLANSMNSGRHMWDHLIKGNPNVLLMIETRLETTGALIHVVDPNNSEHVRMWERYWYPDDEATTAGMSCGTATSLGPIADFTACLAVWQLVRAAQINGGFQDRLDNQIRISMIPLSINPYQW
jgi:hypothetical protein